MQDGSMQKLNLPDPRTKPRPDVLETTSDALSQEIDDLRHAYDRVRQSCEELRADLDWLAGEIKSVRGHVTGGSRKPKEVPANGHEQAVSGIPTRR
jgi:hypothetical protein